MPIHDAAHAYDYGYFAATHGFSRHTMPRGTWLTEFSADWLIGFDDAARAGRWGIAR